jgi:predicted dehydrogenase/nucleoside-diphosphate-sugar epimerase
VRIAITGVTGFIGRHLATQALARGWEVIALSRRPWSGPPYVPLENRHFVELPARPDPALLQGVSAVVHLAIASPTATPAVVDAVNRLGTLRLFESAAGAGVGRFVFVSSQSAHAHARSAYGRSKFAVERELAAEARVVIVRPGLVYGDADDGLMGRAARTAAKLRFFPDIGGAASRAQPIHVDALCAALLDLAVADEPPALVELADPTVRELGGLVQARALERFGVKSLRVPVPIGVARAAVRLASRLHLPSPISEENIDGIASFRPMDTTADMERLGLRHRAQPAAPPSAVAVVQPRRLILVGAGRIGLVHALTAAHHQRMVLVGIVDLDRSALGRLKAFAGKGVAAFTDLDQALTALRPDVAIIGTPPSSHVPLATKLLEAGVDVLIEKPVAASDCDRVALAAAISAHPDRYVGTGYLAGVLPHLTSIAADFRAGRYGTPLSFDAHAFVSRVGAAADGNRAMWELDPSISGGGALVNLGVHVLAMVDLLLGPADVERGVLVMSGGRSAEDGASLELHAAGIHGRFSTAWHLPGFDLAENHLRIDTDRGYLVCTTSCVAFVGGGDVHVVHQLDADRHFDLAPMDAGGAFWAEQDLLARHHEGANSAALADRVEALITTAYSKAERIVRPALPAVAAELHVARDTRPVMPDLRGAPAGIIDAWSGPALTGTLTEHVDALELPMGSIISLPDAPGHFRTLTNQGPRALVRELGIGRLGRAALGVAPPRALSGAGRTWEALLLLLRAELARIPRQYAEALVVDAYLVDLATATGNIDVIGAALNDLRRHCPGARIGVEVNAGDRLSPHIPAIASRLDIVVALGTTKRAGLAGLAEMVADRTELVVKTGVLPHEILEIAWAEPERWTGNRGTLVVHWPGAPDLRPSHIAALASAKEAAGLQPALR